MRVKYAIACLSPQPPEWAEKMLGESQEYFGPIAEALTHPVDAIKAIAQETSDTYETEGLVYTGAYVIADIMIGKAVTAGISKATGTGAGAVDEIGDVTNKADDVAEKGKLKVPDYVKLSEELRTQLEKEGYKIIDIEDALQANADWADIGYDLPPVAKNTKVYNLEAGDFTYARVFKEGVNKPKSPFILRAEDIKGLTASEIAEKYALPQVPDKVVYPDIPSDLPLEVSIVGPQESWGTIGGDVQYAIKDALLDDDWFTDIHTLD